MCYGMLSKEWNGGSCILSDMKLADESTDQLSEPICAFHVLVNSSHSPWKSNFSGMCICPLPSGPYLVVLPEVFDLNVFSCLPFNFKNLACSKILRVEKTKKQKPMVAIKAFDCMAASEVNCALDRGRSL